MYAVIYVNLRIVQQLLNAGADVTIENDNGVTALWLAQYTAHPNNQLIELLKKTGAIK